MAAGDPITKVEQLVINALDSLTSSQLRILEMVSVPLYAAECLRRMERDQRKARELLDDHG